MPINIIGNRNLRVLLEQKATTHADKTFLVFEDADRETHSFSFSEVNRLVNQTANGLLDLGLRKGDKLNLHLTNCPEFIFSWFAAAKIGAVIVPTNPLSPADELKHPMRHSESVLSITQPDLVTTVQAVQESMSDLREVLVIGKDPAPMGTIAFRQLVSGSSENLTEVDLDPTDDAGMLYTSGTTSLPKGVRVTHANYIYTGEVVSRVMRLQQTDRQLVVLPLYHANAQYYMFMSALVTGASVALMPRFSASRFVEQAREHEATVTSLFAAPIRMILAQLRGKRDADHNLRLAIFAQNVTRTQLDEWEERFRIPLLQIYGMTETVGQPVANPFDLPRDNMMMGMVTLGYECKVVDDNGDEVPVGIPGQLLVSGRPAWTVMKGYFKNTQATESTIRDGWLWTGDIVERREDGFLRFVDRAKDMIKRAGENVAAGEVEAVIKLHPGVVDAAVIGVLDPMRDESIKAFVILDDKVIVSEQEIIEFCQERLSKFRVPEFVEFRDEFPRTSVGKIQKHVLRLEQ